MKGFYQEQVKQLPPDALFAVKAAYSQDTRETKVDLGIGAYRDNSGKPWILPSVRLAEELLQHSPDYNHEYLPITGLPEFTSAAAKVILGSQSPAIAEGRVTSVQTLSGTGALHVAAKFLQENYKSKDGSGELPIVYLSNPTWANHFQLFEFAGFQVAEYPYWDDVTKTLNLEGFLQSIKDAPEGSIFLLHATAHNPTGLDPTKEQWLQILKAIEAKNHLPLFDSAYQGFSSGSLEKDAWAVRTAVEDGYKYPGIVICQSFAKNVGMYGERAGAVHVILPEQNSALNSAIKSQLARVIRSELSNPPAYGAKIVSKILNTPELYTQWEDDLVTMSSRIYSMRSQLVEELKKLGTPGDWEFIKIQQGMFSYTGLNKEQVLKLRADWGVYMAGSGRASIAGLNEGNVAHVAKAIDAVVRG
ncbi:aspartate transaminase [Martiniozyma asiatica (nom. inval.)]|nr:aspartate transaminase [Martiniozyma asiatica]